MTHPEQFLESNMNKSQYVEKELIKSLNAFNKVKKQKQVVPPS